ncbi:coiled-coil domain-containing protein 63-like [Hydractinia symbiolongicarpus]|uniref:coiled-coil domain-containing protein 63-like n=1 Tax=Hydractinia symbiolongicarpus TaxID=13093 RepID=UPI00254C8A0B|nr:coiled-coil domain-containing protein 63-like [Hydractinia symbiolongicarpus]
MPRFSSRRSESSEMEVDGIEQELIRLQQEYRIMEGDRKAYSEESQNIIRKQREAISALQAENEELMKENRLAGSQQNQTNDSKNIDRLSALLQEEGQLKERVRLVKEAILKWEQGIQQTERKIAQRRKSMGGVHMSQAKHVALHKQIRVLENRLDQANRKFNAGLAENSKLREGIDHMRTERMIFQGLYDKLEKKQSDNKEEIAKVIETSTSAYDARDDAQSKMLALKEKSDKDLLQYNMELKELMRIIDHDRKLREFMNIKSEDRAEMHGLSMQYNSKREEREKVGEKEETIQSYESAFEQIKETTEIDDLQLLVGKFIETEDKNFALFNYVNELNNEIEMLREQIVEVENEIELFKQDSVGLEEQRERIMKDLQDEHDIVDSELKVHVDHTTASVQTVEQLKEGINSLFTMINCDSSSIVDMLGGHEGITDSNMMQYLGIIEHRTNELIQVQAFASSKQDSESDEKIETVGLLGKGPLPIPRAVSVHPPATVDDYDSDFSMQSDDENRPLTQRELRQRIVRGISKKSDTKSKKEKDNRDPPSFEVAHDERPASKSKKSTLKEL